MKKVGYNILSDLEDALDSYDVSIDGPYTDGDVICFEIDYDYDDFDDGEEDNMRDDLDSVIDDWGLNCDWDGSHIFLSYEE